MQNALVFLVKAYLKPVLGNSSKIGYYKVNFHNVYIELHKISTEVKMILKQEIIELVRLSAAKYVRDVSFSSPWIRIRTRSLISYKYIYNATEYVS